MSGEEEKADRKGKGEKGWKREEVGGEEEKRVRKGKGEKRRKREERKRERRR